MNSKNYIRVYLVTLLSLILLFSGIVIYTDPYFHYHKPQDNLDYVLGNQRYQNNGISKHFEYDAIITGTSMTENFRVSQLNELFDVNAIKLPYSGASFKEINNSLIKSISYNPNIKMIVRGLDTDAILHRKDHMSYDNMPNYLYDNNIFNDLNYLLNKDLYFNDLRYLCLEPTIDNKSELDFDEYSRWMDDSEFGYDKVIVTYNRPDHIDYETQKALDETYKPIVYDNIKQNVTSIVTDNPNVEFYYFFTPLSILHFDKENRRGILEEVFNHLEYATELMLEHDNIKLYSILDNYDIITNLDNYKDVAHHKDYINELMLENMKNNVGLLTKNNYKQHFNELRNFYLTYDYESIF